MSHDDPEERWQRASLALACFALSPAALGGLWLRARVGPVRERFLGGLELGLRGQKVSRLHPDIGDEALFGGIDLAATLGTGSVTRTSGLLQRPGILILPMAERAKPRLAARLAQALDERRPLALVALDEGAGPEERIPESLADRLAIHLDLSDIPLGQAPDLALDTDALVEARRLLPGVTVPEEAIASLAEVAFGLGIASLRAPLQALALARASAALSGETEVAEPDLLTAVELVLAPRATVLPPADAPEENQDTPEDQSEPEAADASEDEQGGPEDSGDAGDSGDAHNDNKDPQSE
ncbi:MAG: magnesium chelatase ATPase subunit D, partial [Roseicyclus sp.]